MRLVTHEEETEQQTALYEAIKHSNNAEAVKLIESGMDVNIFLRNYPESLLDAAIESDNLELVKLLVAHGAEVNYTIDSTFDEFSRDLVSSPLFTAVNNKATKCAEFLIEQGADVNWIKQRDWEKNPVIHCAIYNSMSGILKLMLAHNADLLSKYDNWFIPAESAACSNNSECFELLENAMIEADLTRYLLPSYAALGNLEKVREIIDSGVDIKQDNLESRAILFAAEKEHENCLKFLLEHAESIENGHGAIHASIINNYIDCLKLMFAKGCDVNTIFHDNYDGHVSWSNTPLCEALLSNSSAGINNNLELVEMFIALGADVNLQKKEDDEIGPTPLQCAIDSYPTPPTPPADDCYPFQRARFEKNKKEYILDKERSEKCIKLLLEHGADVNRLGRDIYNYIQRTPVHTAAREGKTDCLKLLLEYHPDLTIQDENGDTAADLAAKEGNSECFELLLNATDGSALKLLSSFASLGKLDKINQLIDSGIDLNANNIGNDAILLAAKNQHEDCLKILIEHIDTIDKKNMAIYYAAENGYAECLKQLIDKGCDVNTQFDHDRYWQTETFPLLAAAAENHVDCVKILLEHGANPNATAYSTEDKVDETALCAACRINAPECVDLLLAHGADVDLRYPLGDAVYHSHEAIIRKLLDNGAKVIGLCSAVGNFGGDESLQIDILKLLLEHINKDENVINKGGDDSGRTPLIRLCHFSYDNKQIQKGLAELLLSHGADVNAKDSCGNTALHAIFDDYTHKQEDSLKDIIELLLSHGADVNAVDDDRDTPLHKAARRDYVGDSIASLLAHGADIHARNRNDQTPLDIAKTSKNEAAIKLLTEREQ